MRNRISRAILASNPGLPADVAETCQRILAMREDMHPWLATNPEIAPAVWRILWGKTRPEAAIAQGLVARDLDAAQRSIVITKENRVGVLRTFIERNELTLEEQKLLSGKANAATALLEQPWLDGALRKPLAILVGGTVLLRELALAPESTFTDEELCKLTCSYPSWALTSNDPRKGAKDRNRYLRILFGRRPCLIKAVTEHLLSTGTLGRQQQDLLTAIAGSAHLNGDAAEKIASVTDGLCSLSGTQFNERYYCLLALVNNPRCPGAVVEAVREAARRSSGDSSLFADAAERRATRPTLSEPFSSISDKDTLEWVIRRSLPYRGNETTRPARPIELLELGKNPNLTEEQRMTVRNAITGHVETELILQDDELIKMLWSGKPPSQTAMVTPGRTHLRQGNVQAAFDLGASKLGNDPVRWETLISLLDDYDGTFEELVSLSESI